MHRGAHRSAHAAHRQPLRVSGTIVAENLPSSTDVFTVLETRTWADANPDAGTVDMALMWLDRAPPVTPLNWDWDTRQPQPGLSVRHIGYGGPTTEAAAPAAP